MLTWSVGNMAASSEGEVTAEVQAYLEKHKISSLMKVRREKVGKQTVHASWVRDGWFLLTGLDVKDCQRASRWPSGVLDFKTANFASAEEEGTCSNNGTLGADFHSRRWVVLDSKALNRSAISLFSVCVWGSWEWDYTVCKLCSI